MGGFYVVNTFTVLFKQKHLNSGIATEIYKYQSVSYLFESDTAVFKNGNKRVITSNLLGRSAHVLPLVVFWVQPESSQRGKVIHASKSSVLKLLS